MKPPPYRSRTFSLPWEQFVGTRGPASNIANWRCYFGGRSVPEELAVASFAPSTPSNVAKKAKRSKAPPGPGRFSYQVKSLFRKGGINASSTM
jgi:hypothetical protein